MKQMTGMVNCRTIFCESSEGRRHFITSLLVIERKNEEKLLFHYQMIREAFLSNRNKSGENSVFTIQGYCYRYTLIYFSGKVNRFNAFLTFVY